MSDTQTTNAARKLWQVRLWFVVTWLCAVPIQLLSRAMHARMGAEPQRFDERLGKARTQAKQPMLWIHAASLGEVAQTGPIVRHFEQRGKTVLVTTTTKAGADWVASNLPGVLHQYAPIETAAAVRRFLASWDICAAIFVEGDFGPRLTLAAQERGIPMALLNARHSRTRERFAAVYAELLTGFALITCRTNTIASSFRAMGLADRQVHVLPDLRIGTGRLPLSVDVLRALSTQIGARPIWLAASTHQGDERAVLRAHGIVLETVPDSLLIIAPRHPNRGRPIEQDARANGFSTARRSEKSIITTNTQIYIADTLGELGAFLSHAPITFLGGSFGDEGGHNPYEPASFGTAILSGPKVKNFAEAFDALCQSGAAELVHRPEALGPRLVDLMQTDQARAMGAAGSHFMEASASSVPKTIALLEDVLGV